jgi:aminopeptidase N
MSHDSRFACCRLGQRGADFSRPDAEAHYPPDLGLEPIHLDIALHLDLEAQTAVGTVTTTVAARRAGPRRLTLDGVDLAITAVEDADGHALTWHYDGQKLAVTWADECHAEERRRLAVSYHVTRPPTGLYFSRPTPEEPNGPWFAATDHETERARYWLTCIDHPNVRPRLDLHLRADERFTILANGRLVREEAHDDGTKTAHWRLDAPCPSYLTCFLVGELTRVDDGEVDGKPIAYFAPAHYDAEDLRRSFGRTRDMLVWLQNKLGSPLPWPKYYQFAVPNIGGAMENISLVSWDDRFVLDETLAREWTWLVDVINVHEMAHTWFGDHIVCRDFAHAWLKESWATYLETCWLEDVHGEDEARYNGWVDAERYFSEADERYQRPIVTRRFDHSWDMYDMHLYPGGAWRLHMLRRELGDATFWAAVQDYVARYGGAVVETDDFRRVLEAHSGRSLVRFFDQWLHRPGYPKLEVTFAHDAERGEGTFEIKQKQVQSAPPTSRKSGSSNGTAGPVDDVPVFQLDLDLAWTVDGARHARTVTLERAEHTVVVPMPKAPDMVRVDPEGKVLHRLELNPGDARLRRQLTDAPDVVGRIQAAFELAKTGRERNLDALADAYRREAFWGVRVEQAKALAKARTDRAVGVLAELVAEEQDPMVLAPLFRAAGGLRDARIRDALSARLDGDLPYFARAAALEGLGKQRGAAPVERLREASLGRSWHGIVEAGALLGLGESRDPRTIDRLMAASKRGASLTPARWAAVQALGRLGPGLERGPRERVVEHLVDLLSDPNERLVSDAIGALQATGATEAIPALHALAKRAPTHLQAHLRRTLEAVRKRDEPRSKALEKQVESLEDRLRTLEGLVRKLEARHDHEPQDEGA